MKKTTDNKKEQGPKPKLRFGLGWIYGIMMVIILLPYLLNSFTGYTKEISWNEFDNTILSRGAVEKLDVINGEKVDVYIKDSLSKDPQFKEVFSPRLGKGVNPGPHYRFTIGSVESFDRKLDEAQKNVPGKDRITVNYIKKTNWAGNLLGWLLPVLLLIFFWRMFMRSGGFGAGGSGGTGGISPFNFSNSTATLQEKENKSLVTFNDVAGLDEAKQEVKEIVDFLKSPDGYTRLGAKIPRGVIIVGPPGTGKTLLAKAVAGEAQVPFFSLSGSEFVEMFVGVGASRVRDLFRKAKAKAPSIIFIDEIDAVGRSRGGNAFYTGANDERESTLNQLLTEMDGFGTNSGVIVLAATNRADMLDPALLRPGRFDRHIYLELPNLTEREAIFKVHLKPLLLGDFGDARYLASQTPGFSGADIANICNEAALIAARKKREKVEKQDFLDAIDRIVAGLEKKSKIITDAEKRIIAHHEAGHAVTSWYLRHVDPLIKVSIIPRGKSLGAAWYLPEERQLKTEAEFTEMICASLGGRAAEDIIFGEVSSGALDDLEKVTKEAYTMVAYYGFDPKIGNISFYDSGGRQEHAFQKPYSENTARLIDEEVRKLVADAYERTKALLLRHKTGLLKLAERLLQKEVVFREELEEILGAREDKTPEEKSPIAS